MTSEDAEFLSDEDNSLLNALRLRGLRCRTASWKDPDARWNLSKVTVVRHPSDYMHHSLDFRRWIARTSGQTFFINSASGILWNMDRMHLLDLEAPNLRVLSSRYLMTGQIDDTESALKSMACRHVVMRLITEGVAPQDYYFDLDTQTEAALSLAARLLTTDDLVVQPRISHGRDCNERSLIFVCGQFSHAVRRTAPPFTRTLKYAEHLATIPEIEFCKRAIDRCSFPVHCAKLDLISTLGEFILTGINVIDPNLFLEQNPECADRLAGWIGELCDQPHQALYSQ